MTHRAQIDGVQAMLTERARSGAWTWVTPRELVIADPAETNPYHTPPDADYPGPA